MVASFGFLSRKPQIVVFNIGEDQQPLVYTSPHPHTGVVIMPTKLEMDLAALEPEDATMFMEEFGMTETGLVKLIRMSYDLLGLQTFFTAGEKEVHAWTLRRGGTAKEAAGVIHTDLEKGFIRAEIVSYEDMIKYGCSSATCDKGRLRVEGKDYPMADGDIIEVRFNI